MSKKIFRPYDMNNSEGELHRHCGQTVIASPLDETLYDRENVGPMFHVRFADGFEVEAFAEELSDLPDSSWAKVL